MMFLYITIVATVAFVIGSYVLVTKDARASSPSPVPKRNARFPLLIIIAALTCALVWALFTIHKERLASLTAVTSQTPIFDPQTEKRIVVKKGVIIKVAIGDLRYITAIPLFGRIDGEAEWKLYLPGSIEKPGELARLPFGKSIELKSEEGDFEVTLKKNN